MINSHENISNFTNNFCCCLVTKSCPTFCNPWTVAHRAPLSMGFPRDEYWSGLPFPSAGDLPDPGIEHASPALAGDSLPLDPNDI